MIGAYPPEGTYNLCRGDNPADRDKALKTIPNVPVPASDPVLGKTAADEALAGIRADGISHSFVMAGLVPAIPSIGHGLALLSEIAGTSPAMTDRETMSDWVRFYDFKHSVIYVNARHRDVHYRRIAEDIRDYVPSPTAHVLDYGCGEATSADLVADACGHLTMVEAAPNVRASLTSAMRPSEDRRDRRPSRRPRCRRARSISS